MRGLLLIALLCLPVMALAGEPDRSKEPVVLQLDPDWARIVFNEEARRRKVKAATIVFCGAGLPPCADDEPLLRELMAQCPKVLFGIIDLDVYPQVPRDLFGAVGSRFNGFLTYTGYALPILRRYQPEWGEADPVVMAMASCPEEFGLKGPEQARSE